MKMTAELRAAWIAKLRSGEVAQCRGMLRDGDARCCLGVLSDMAGVGGYPAKIGLMSFSHSGAMQLLNDKDELTFPEIADWLEANPTLCPVDEC
jgi:hypothetical protein